MPHKLPARCRKPVIVRCLRLCLLVLMQSALITAAQAQPASSGLPLPRFASLAAERINVRTGPGKQYPIRWVYARSGYPVKIVAEFETWRQIQDHEGDEGWVHVSLLSGRRTVMVQSAVQALTSAPQAGGPVVLRAEPGVIGRLSACGAAFCELEIDGSRGWMAHADLWGVLARDFGG